MSTNEIMGLIRDLCEEVRQCAAAGEPPSQQATALREQIRMALEAINSAGF